MTGRTTRRRWHANASQDTSLADESGVTPFNCESDAGDALVKPLMEETQRKVRTRKIRGSSLNIPNESIVQEEIKVAKAASSKKTSRKNNKESKMLAKICFLGDESPPELVEDVEEKGDSKKKKRKAKKKKSARTKKPDPPVEHSEHESLSTSDNEESKPKPSRVTRSKKQKKSKSPKTNTTGDDSEIEFKSSDKVIKRIKTRNSLTSKFLKKRKSELVQAVQKYKTATDLSKSVGDLSKINKSAVLHEEGRKSRRSGQRASPRRTYDLEKSQNDVAILKRQSLRKSVRFNLSSAGSRTTFNAVKEAEPEVREAKPRKTVRIALQQVEIINKSGSSTPVRNSRKTSSHVKTPKLNNVNLNETIEVDSNEDVPTIEARNASTPFGARKDQKSSSSSSEESVICISSPVAKKFTRTSTPNKSVISDAENKSVLNCSPIHKRVKPKNTPRTKMPNFALIHQKANEKVENLQEMQARKAERARMLLSGQKPSQNTSMKVNTPRLPVKKHLFDAKPTPKKASPIKKKKIATKSALPRPVAVVQPQVKVPKKVMKKVEAVKAVTTKAKVGNSRLEANRHEIKGVRTNRRFELLMSMRSKNM